MARRVKDANLDTRAARSRLKPRHEPYWRAIEPGRSIGYRKGDRGGVWKARLMRDDASYVFKTLGRADDMLDADGAEILSFSQAQAKAREWFAAVARGDAGLSADAGPYTVGHALDDYLAAYKAGGTKGGGRALADTRRAIEAHIRPALGAIPCDRLTTARIEKWFHDLAASPARRRARPGKQPKPRPAPTDPDALRRRRATANRVLTVLKAALNRAWRAGRVPSDAAWRKVAPFHHVDTPVVRYLTEAESARLVNACPEDFRQLVRAALLTGCRYGELVRLRAADFNPDAGTLAVRQSKSGKARHVILTDEARTFFEDATAGRDGHELVFKRADGEPWGKSHQQRPLTAACERAKISPPISFHVLRHTHGSILAMRGVPLPVIAKQLGHSDTRMTERHYAHLAPSYVAETIRASFPKLGIVEPSNVRPLSKRP